MSTTRIVEVSAADVKLDDYISDSAVWLDKEYDKVIDITINEGADKPYTIDTEHGYLCLREDQKVKVMRPNND